MLPMPGRPFGSPEVVAVALVLAALTSAQAGGRPAAPADPGAAGSRSATGTRPSAARRGEARPLPAPCSSASRRRVNAAGHDHRTARVVPRRRDPVRRGQPGRRQSSATPLQGVPRPGRGRTMLFDVVVGKPSRRRGVTAHSSSHALKSLGRSTGPSCSAEERLDVFVRSAFNGKTGLRRATMARTETMDDAGRRELVRG